MTAADYLEARGWMPTGTADDGVECWADPWAVEMDGFAAEDAVTVQKARDEEKAREAWVAFAAARVGMVGSNGDGGPDALYSLAGVAHLSDELLVLYRARFCPKVTP